MPASEFQRLFEAEQMQAEILPRAGTLDEANQQLRAADEELARLYEKTNRLQEQLEAANNELEAFSYSVSHDLRSPLRSIDGFSQALLEDYRDCLDETGKGYLERVRAATQRMGQLIDDLLHLSRVTRSELCRQPVDLSAMAHRITDELHRREPERPVEFVIAEGLAVEGDRRLLQVALENLLGNAWKYSSKRARARVEFGVSELRAPGANGELPAYFVRDNGVGFDQAYVHKLFGAFQRLHGMNEFPGTGIGLATVQRIVRRHGGEAWAEGAVDQGATIYFTLEPGGRDGEQDHSAGGGQPGRRGADPARPEEQQHPQRGGSGP
jgi:light-regulated signal transduction histidine kinase (bacteriophytochrome)